MELVAVAEPHGSRSTLKSPKSYAVQDVEGHTKA